MNDIFYTLVGMCLGFFMFHVLISPHMPPIPQGSDIKQWVNFTDTVVYETNNRPVYFIIPCLAIFHAMHILLAMPFMYITKIFYGVFLPIPIGFASCVIVELCLVSIGTMYFDNMSIKRYEKFENVLKNFVKSHGVVVFTAMAQMSSFPQCCTNAVITNGITTKKRFVLIHSGVTVFTTAKDMAAAYCIREAHKSVYMTLAFSVLLMTSGLIPIILSVYMTSFSGYLLHTYSQEEEKTPTAVVVQEHNPDSGVCQIYEKEYIKTPPPKSRRRSMWDMLDAYHPPEHNEGCVDDHVPVDADSTNTSGPVADKPPAQEAREESALESPPETQRSNVPKIKYSVRGNNNVDQHLVDDL